MLHPRWLLAALLVGCHSPGPYGHSPVYAPLDDEAAAAQNAKDYDPVMYARQTDEWRKRDVSLFGVVEDRQAGPGGAAQLKLSVRRLEPRNLCENMRDDDSCRVTVSDKDFGLVYALVQLRGEDDVGPKSVSIKSLLRVIGRFGEDVNPSDGAPILHATYYRQWPAFSYVTRASARDMHQ
jgi:hypothetical protein